MGDNKHRMLAIFHEVSLGFRALSACYYCATIMIILDVNNITINEVYIYINKFILFLICFNI